MGLASASRCEQMVELTPPSGGVTRRLLLVRLPRRRTSTRMACLSGRLVRGRFCRISGTRGGAVISRGVRE